jgi:hypothetical protein
VRILAALFIDTIDLRQVAGPSTRIDLGGVKFSEVAPEGYPCQVEPHLVVMVHNPEGAKPDAVLEVTYWRRPGDGEGDDEQIARNVQPLQVEPGKFNYRLVRAELAFDEPGTVEARCSIDRADPVIVPFTMLEA